MIYKANVSKWVSQPLVEKRKILTSCHVAKLIINILKFKHKKIETEILEKI